MKFRTPRTVKILATRLKVSLVDLAGECGRQAEIRFWKKEIRLDKDNPNAESLLHEIVHSVDEQLALNMDEDNVSRMGTALATLIADNPRLFHHLADVLGGGQ